MAAVTKTAELVALSEGPTIIGPADASGNPTEVPTMNLGVILGRDTPGEQRVSFMVLGTDYTDLGQPGYGAQIDITLAIP